MTSKKRKYGDLSARPLPSEDPTLIDDVFAAFTGTRPSTPALAENSEPEAQPMTPALGAAPAQRAAAAQESPEPLHRAAAAQQAAPAQQAAVAGYTRVSNDLLDRILPTLDTYDQAVLVRLYRLSRGFNSDLCRVSVPTLAKACNVSERQVRKSVGKLEARQLIQRIEQDFGNKDKSLRGTIFRILIADPTPARGATHAQYSTPAHNAAAARGAANKDKALKETTLTQEQPSAAGVGVGSRFSLKQCIAYAKHRRTLDPNIRSPEAIGRKLHETGREDELIAEWLTDNKEPKFDASQCPDCHGTGMYYPEGVGKGVKKCPHERLERRLR